MLETRRIRADLIEVFKILRGMAGAVEGMGLVRDSLREAEGDMIINCILTV